MVTAGAAHARYTKPLQTSRGNPPKCSRLHFSTKHDSRINIAINSCNRRGLEGGVVGKSASTGLMYFVVGIIRP
eukprot:9503907-Pyramimonas_sp.AAC.4